MTVGFLPNFLIIGAGKCGTSSLHRYLSLHPDIFMSQLKELRFFDAREPFGRFRLGLEWYMNHFPVNAKARGEASPQYSFYPNVARVPEMIREVLGQPKLIYLVRDPIERLRSDHMRILDEYYFTRTFDEEISDIKQRDSYHRSRYFLQLSQYLNVFPRENIHVVVSERLQRDRRATLKKVFEFLDVDSDFWTPDFDAVHNKAKSNTKKVASWFDKCAPHSAKRLLHDNTLRSGSWQAYRALHWVSRLGGEPVAKSSLAPEQDAYLQTVFRDDVARLRDYLCDPIPEWRSYS